MATSLTDETAQALWYVGPGQAELREQALPPPGAADIRVRALYGAVSRGTEALVLAGRVPPSEYQRMRAPFMAGDFPFPVKYGYATAGRVEAASTARCGGTLSGSGTAAPAGKLNRLWCGCSVNTVRPRSSAGPASTRPAVA